MTVESSEKETDVKETNVDKPGVKETDVKEPGVEGKDVKEPDVEGKDVKEPDVEEKEVKEADVEEPDVEEKEVKEADVEEPDVEKPDVEEADVKEPDVEGKDVKEPDVEEPDVEEKDVKEPDVEEKDVKEPDVEEADVKEPDVKEPDVEETDVKEPDVEEKNVKEPDVEETVERNEPKALLLPQIITSIICSNGYFLCGTIMGWSGASITQLDHDFEMDNTSYSLVVSMALYGSLFGSLMSGKMMDLLGRKKFMLLVGPLTASGWMMMGLASHIYLLYFGRFICGLSTGFLLTSCSVYISETVQATLRGRLGSLNSLNMTLGVLAVYILGGFCKWQLSALLCIIPTGIFFIGICFVPESPYWYLLKENSKAAEESLLRLKGKHYPIKADIEDMFKKISDVGFNFSYRELLHRRTLIPIAVAILVHTLQQVSGFNVLMSYSNAIFEQAHSSIDSTFATVYTGVAQLVGILTSMFLIDRCGRQFLLMVSGGLCGLIMGLFGGYYITMDTPKSWPEWIPLFLIIFHAFTYCLGLISIPYLMGTELFNTTVRSKANSIIMCYNRVLCLVFLQSYPYTVKAIGEGGLFIVFGVLSVLCVLLTRLFVPETKGKTLEQIQEHFEKKSFKTKRKVSA